MARKIRFPLKMRNGSEVRTLEELRENFDIESILGYYVDGKLATWLRDRYYDDLAETVSALKLDGMFLILKLCELLEVRFTEDMIGANLDTIIQKNGKMNHVRQITDDKEIIDSFENVAFTQNEFEILLHKTDVKTIYLYGESFYLPLIERELKIIGINNPKIEFGDQNYSDFTKYGLKIENSVYKRFEWEGKNKGDIFTFGRYQDEPIEWMILDILPDHILVLSAKVIDFKAFRTDFNLYTTDGQEWIPSSIRKWLDQEFLRSFTTDEKNRIIYNQTVQNKVFLLSETEVEKYLTNNTQRMIVLSAYAKQVLKEWHDKNRRAPEADDPILRWYLRPNRGSGYVPVVWDGFDKGKILHFIAPTYVDGIRPAMLIDTT